MYHDNFVAALKVDGRILREDKDLVQMPFESEYGILLKNLGGTKCVVSIHIDGQDVLNSKQVIVEPNKEVELERFLDDDMSKGNRFKFIQKTQKIQEYRGDKVDDGLIRIEYQFEKPVVMYTQYLSGISNPQYFGTARRSGYGGQGMSASMSMGSEDFSVSANSLTSGEVTKSMPQVDEGITVKGSESSQKFRAGSVGALEDEKHVIVLRLTGMKKDIVVESPVFVNTKKICTTCGTHNNSGHKFCKECGTYL